MNWLWVFIGGGLGAVSRYGISLLTPYFLTSQFPIATFISNTLATAILALTIYQFKDIKAEWIYPFVIIGFCGGFSTFSTFSNDNFQLAQQGNWIFLIFNVLISTGAGLFLIWLIASGKNGSI
jgi:fluoride exporter